MRYLESGGRGRDMVLIHGLGASAERWQFVAPLLVGEYRLVIPDLPGFGYSDKPAADYTQEFFSDFVGGLLDELGIRRAHLVGSSLGGQVAAWFAAGNPGAVDRLVLVSSSGAMKLVTPALQSYIMAGLYPSIEAATRAFFDMSASREVDPRIAESFVRRMHMPNAKMAFMSTLLGLKNSGGMAERLRKITAPTLVVWGSLDPVIPVKFAEAFHSAIGDCSFYRMEGSGHTPFVDSPEKFSRAVLSFLAG